MFHCEPLKLDLCTDDDVILKVITHKKYFVFSKSIAMYRVFKGISVPHYEIAVV